MMNERIKELANCNERIQNFFETGPVQRAAIEQFAELIVRECIEQLEIGKSCDPYTGELFSCDRNDNIDYEIAVLKEHFGVEE